METINEDSGNFQFPWLVWVNPVCIIFKCIDIFGGQVIFFKQPFLSLWTVSVILKFSSNLFSKNTALFVVIRSVFTERLHHRWGSISTRAVTDSGVVWTVIWRMTNHFWSLLSTFGDSISNPLGWKSLRGFLRKGAGDHVFLFLGSQYFRSMVQAFGCGVEREAFQMENGLILSQCYFTMYIRKRFTLGFLLVTSFNQGCFNSRVWNLNESLMFELFSRTHLWRVTVLLSSA